MRKENRPSKVIHRFPVLSTGLHRLALGNASAFDIAVINAGIYMFVGVYNSGGSRSGCYHFACDPDPGYVMEKLHLLEGDAACMADFISDQLDGCRTPPGIPPARRFGQYMESMCGDATSESLVEEVA